MKKSSCELYDIRDNLWTEWIYSVWEYTVPNSTYKNTEES